jgi:hypothetical protein
MSGASSGIRDEHQSSRKHEKRSSRKHRDHSEEARRHNESGSDHEFLSGSDASDSDAPNGDRNVSGSDEEEEEEEEEGGNDRRKGSGSEDSSCNSSDEVDECESDDEKETACSAERREQASVLGRLYPYGKVNCEPDKADKCHDNQCPRRGCIHADYVEMIDLLQMLPQGVEVPMACAGQINQCFYKFDLPPDPDASPDQIKADKKAKQTMLDQLNKMSPAAARDLTLLYDPDVWSEQTRFHATFPCEMLRPFHPSDVKIRDMHMAPLLMESANAHTLSEYRKADARGNILLVEDPHIAIDKADTDRLSELVAEKRKPSAASHPKGKHAAHASRASKFPLLGRIPLLAVVKAASNSLPSTLELELHVPNVGYADGVNKPEKLYKCMPHPSALDNVEVGPQFTERDGERIRQPVLMQVDDRFRNPETARWAYVDYDQVSRAINDPDSSEYKKKKKKEKEKHSSKSSSKSRRRYLQIPLRPDPTTLAEFLVVSYSHALMLNSTCMNCVAPVVIDGKDVDKKDGEHAGPYVEIDADVFSDMVYRYSTYYSPYNYAANRNHWRLSAHVCNIMAFPYGQAIKQEWTKQPVHVSVDMRIFYLPFPFPRQQTSGRAWHNSDKTLCKHLEQAFVDLGATERSVVEELLQNEQRILVNRKNAEASLLAQIQAAEAQKLEAEREVSGSEKSLAEQIQAAKMWKLATEQEAREHQQVNASFAAGKVKCFNRPPPTKSLHSTNHSQLINPPTTANASAPPNSTPVKVTSASAMAAAMSALSQQPHPASLNPAASASASAAASSSSTAGKHCKPAW